MRAVTLALAAIVAGAAALSLLAGCGQKGPLFLPTAQGTSARPAARVPSAPEAEDRMPPPPAVPPMPTEEPVPAPTGVVSPRK